MSSKANGSRSAVAIAYDGESSAPTVVAKGSGLIADKIVSLAQENGVFVHESKELLSLLMAIDLDHQIPPALYRAIAELLAWLYHIEQTKKSGEPIPSLALPLPLPTPPKTGPNFTDN
jgi:flagellar biosynthesis protein